MRGGWIIPGIHSDAHRRAFFAGRDRYLAAGGPRKCAAHAKHGRRCGGWALRGEGYCSHHASNAVRRARRLALLRRPISAAQADRLKRRESARLQRVLWKRDRWAAGSTVTLGGRDDAFAGDLRTLGFALSDLSPATADAARWVWLHVEAGRMTLDQLRDRMRWHVALDQGAAQ